MHNKAVKEIESLREALQSTCQSTNPLGKTMDYIQEDVDSMNKELEMWKRESLNYAKQEQQQQEETEKSLAPLKIQLKEIDENIDRMVR